MKLDYFIIKNFSIKINNIMFFYFKLFNSILNYKNNKINYN